MINEIQKNISFYAIFIVGYFILILLELYSLIAFSLIVLGFLHFVVRSDKYKYLKESLENIF